MRDPPEAPKQHTSVSGQHVAFRARLSTQSPRSMKLELWKLFREDVRDLFELTTSNMSFGRHELTNHLVTESDQNRSKKWRSLCRRRFEWWDTNPGDILWFFLRIRAWTNGKGLVRVLTPATNLELVVPQNWCNSSLLTLLLEGMQPPNFPFRSCMICTRPTRSRGLTTSSSIRQ